MGKIGVMAGSARFAQGVYPGSVYLASLHSLRGRRFRELHLLEGWQENPNYDRAFFIALLPTLDKLHRDYIGYLYERDLIPALR